MSADANTNTIKTVYEAFGRGDVETILANLTDDVDWAAEATGKGAPWYGDHRAREGVAAFFTQFGSTMEVEDFTPITYAATDNEVLTVVRFAATTRASGRRVAMDLHHYFRFADGKIAYYRGTEDSAQTEAALKD
jgi:uncharacterized protein